MYIYNVTIKVSLTIVSEWIEWMHHEHLDEVISTGMFDRYLFFELLEPKEEEEEARTFVAQYITDSKARYETYINEHAPRLREKGFFRFGSGFIAFRSLMKEVKR